MALANTVGRTRSGLFQIVFLNSADQIVAQGSAFASRGFLITNNHVFSGPTDTKVWIRKDNQVLLKQGIVLSRSDFSSRLVTGSDRNSFDYAVLRIPEVTAQGGVHHFELQSPANNRIGDAVSLLGFPLEHMNLTCHQGIISSFYQSGLAKIIQLDASVNAGNSGGPLIDPETGHALGIITRKATGLTRLFGELKSSIRTNIDVMQTMTGMMSLSGLDPIQALIVGQRQFGGVLDEIERQANVGIGYAFSIDHLLQEDCMMQR
jgi:S1-C subfamily serine protease